MGPHLSSLLGDELIGDDRLAVFELVKNAYDADATRVTVELRLIGAEPMIRISDNGSGMTEETLIGSWMRLATGHKRGQTRGPSKKFHRIPLGEKGVGRLAVQKLGGKLRLVTRAAGAAEYAIEIGWKEFLQSAKDLMGLEFHLQQRDEPEVFLGDAQGTVIEITDLHRTEWERRDLRGLKKLLESLKSPFQNVSDFNVELKIPGREEDIEDLLKSTDILDRAVWIYSFELDTHADFDWKYEFRPPAAFAKRLRGQDLHAKEPEDHSVLGMKLAADDKIIRNPDDRDKLHICERDMEGIGAIQGSFYVFDRRREAFETGTFQQMRKYLDEQTGVRVYRDGVRVFNYGGSRCFTGPTRKSASTLSTACSPCCSAPGCSGNSPATTST